MKKLIVFICFIFLSLPVFAEYKPIPANLSKQYKADMESIINTEYPKVILIVDNYTKDAKNYYLDIKNNGYTYFKYINLVNLAEVCLPSSEIDLYAKLMKVTQEKYLKEKYEPIGTDSTYPYEVFLNKYFQDNQVNTKKLIDIADYEDKQIKIINNYLNEVQKYISTTN